MAFISFIVPIYKVDHTFLKCCIDSILGQTFKDIEAVLVDDGSPDDCGKICDEYASADSRVRVVHKQNGGLSDARNSGAKAASSAWLTFVDGDDWVEPDFAEHFRKRVLSSQKPADMYIYAGCREYAGKTVEADPYFEDGTQFESYEEREKLQAECCLIFTKNHEGLFIGSACGKVYNKAYLDKNGLLFTIMPYGEDSIFYFYSIECAKLVEYVSKTVYHYRDTDDSMVNKYRENADAEHDIYLSELFGFAEKYGKSPEFVDMLYYRVMVSVQRCISQKFFNSANGESCIRCQKKCRRFMKRKPYCDIFRHISFRSLSTNGKIKYIILRSGAYFLLDISRSFYLNMRGAKRMVKTSE